MTGVPGRSAWDFGIGPGTCSVQPMLRSWPSDPAWSRLGKVRRSHCLPGGVRRARRGGLRYPIDVLGNETFPSARLGEAGPPPQGLNHRRCRPRPVHVVNLIRGTIRYKVIPSLSGNRQRLTHRTRPPDLPLTLRLPFSKPVADGEQREQKDLIYQMPWWMLRHRSILYQGYPHLRVSRPLSTKLHITSHPRLRENEHESGVLSTRGWPAARRRRRL